MNEWMNENTEIVFKPWVSELVACQLKNDHEALINFIGNSYCTTQFYMFCELLMKNSDKDY